MDIQDEIDELIETLKRQRDELNLQIRLASMEAREEWAQAEQTWEKFRARTDELGAVGKDASRDVLTAAGLLGDELKTAYEKLRKTLEK